MSVTYEELNQARKEVQEAESKWYTIHRKYLTDVLKEVGFHNNLVRLKSDNSIGMFEVTAQNYNGRPWAIKFYPLTKSGTVSTRSKYLNNFYYWQEDTLVQQLREIAERLNENESKEEVTATGEECS